MSLVSQYWISQLVNEIMITFRVNLKYSVMNQPFEVLFVFSSEILVVLVKKSQPLLSNSAMTSK